MLEIEIIAKTIYGEARGSTSLDRESVGSVIQNRAFSAKQYCRRFSKKRTHPLFGNGTLASACLMPKQFSCWNRNDPNFELLASLEVLDCLKRDLVFIECWKISHAMINGSHEDATKGALHYHTIQMGWPKSWGPFKKPDAEIGGHYYYRSLL